MKSLKIKVSSICFLLLFSGIISCNKFKIVPEKQSEKVHENIPNLNQSLFGKTKWTLSIPFPTSSSLQELFQKDSVTIRNIVNTNNEKQAKIYVQDLADQIAGYYYYNKGIDLRLDFADDPNDVVIFGLFYTAKEVYDQGNTPPSTFKIKAKQEKPNYVPIDPLECVFQAIGDIIGLSNVRTIWASIIGGAGEHTIIAALKLLGGRKVAGFTLVVAVYHTGQCLDWW